MSQAEFGVQGLDPIQVAMRCCCPRCGEGRLYRGYLKIAPGCTACALSYDFADPADGPAFFAMTGVSFVVMALWTAWVIASHPPVWAELAVVLPAMTLGCLATLRPVKAWLVASQYHYKARDVNFVQSAKAGEIAE